MISAYSIAGVLAIAAFVTPCAALDFQLHSNNSKTLNAVLASGTIEYDDANRLHQFLSLQSRRSNAVLYLKSPGGSLGGGIRLGQYLRKNNIKTVVEGGETCASACALAFLGGTDRQGNRWMSTTTTSQLGFHAFRNADGVRNENSDNT